MDAEQFVVLVRETEQRFADDPKAVTRRTVLLAVLCYAYLYAIIGAALLLLVVAVACFAFLKFVAIKLAVFLGAAIFGLLRALVVRVPPIEGRALSEEEAPQLFALIEGVRQKLGAPRIHRVIVEDELNAAIVQRPRLGLFGWYENTLFLGLELMHAVNVDELRAVVAHELGHLSGSHGKIGAWIYRVRRTWGYLREQHEQGRLEVSWALQPLLHFVMPRFHAYSFVLARQNEHEADRCAADVVGAKLAGQALVRTALAAHRYNDEVVPAVLATAEEKGGRAAPPLRTARDVLARAIDPRELALSLHAALRAKSDVVDTHPALSERLQALRVAGVEPPPLGKSAADVFLARLVGGLTVQLSEGWSSTATQMQQKLLERRAHVTTLSSKGDKSVDETIALAVSTLDEHTLATRADRRGRALEILAAALAARPRHGALHMLLGVLQAEARDRASLESLRAATQCELDVRLDAHEALVETAKDLGTADEVEEAQGMWRKAQLDVPRALAERDRALELAKVRPTTMPEPEREALLEALRASKLVSRAWLVDLDVVTAPESPAYLLTVELAGAKKPTNEHLAEVWKRLPMPRGSLAMRGALVGNARFETDDARLL